MACLGSLEQAEKIKRIAKARVEFFMTFTLADGEGKCLCFEFMLVERRTHPKCLSQRMQ